MDEKIKYFMKKLKEIPDFDRVKFVILYGSRASGKESPMSDYDFAVYYDGNEKERFKFLIKASFNEKFDVKIFQNLPIYIRKDVLKGKIIYVKGEDESFVYEAAYETIKAFDDFKKYYYDYIERRPVVI